MSPIERAAYLAHSQSRGYRKRVDVARALIAEHPDYAASVSWGKDSVAMLHLVRDVLGDGCKAINIRYMHWAERLADHDHVRDITLNRPDMAGLVYHEEIAPGMWQAYELYGYASDTDHPSARAATTWFDTQFNAAFARAEDTTGAAGHFVGMRGAESRNRTLNIRMRGVDYERKDGRRIALPIATWSGQDVWAYLVAHDLPWLMIYDHSSQSRDRQRSEMAMSNPNAAMLQARGEFEVWRDVYPREYQAWSSIKQ